MRIATLEFFEQTINDPNIFLYMEIIPFDLNVFVEIKINSQPQTVLRDFLGGSSFYFYGKCYTNEREDQTIVLVEYSVIKRNRHLFSRGLNHHF